MISARVVIDALEARHSRDPADFFVPECQLGSSFRGCGRLDAWVLRSTWSPLTTIGYEVKVSRGDFLRDDKWHAYRDFCHEFYFAAPPGLISKEELPAEVGLLELRGSRMLCRRKAARREPPAEKLALVMAYVLMWRAKPQRKVINRHTPTADDWAQWLADKRTHAAVGVKVAKEIRRLAGDQLADARARSFELERENTRLGRIRQTLALLGITETMSESEIRLRIAAPAAGDVNFTQKDMARLREAHLRIGALLEKAAKIGQ